MNENNLNNIEILDYFEPVKNVEKKIALNENGVDMLSIEILKCAQLVNDYLSKIITIVDATKTHFDCEIGTIYRNKFYEFSKNFPILIQNIENYAYSLRNVENKFRENQNIIVSKLISKSEEINRKNKLGKVEL